MKIIKKLSFLILGVSIIISVMSFIKLDTKTYKCLVQLKNYEGEGAYMVISLVNPEGAYEQTLWVMGEEHKWYDYFLDWKEFWKKDTSSIDAITGESIIGGDRKLVKLAIDPSKLGSGYKLRFETAVEDQEYYQKDVEIDFNETQFKQKIEGTGYIRYIKILPSK